MIMAKLNTFVSHSKNILSSTSSLLASDSPEDILRKRIAWVSQTHFTRDEAGEIARLIIRVLDRGNVYHCERPHCGEECEFYHELCPNAGCGKVYSRKWAQKHDLECAHKILACERVCGENVKRGLMRTHLDQSCGLRIVRCPCYDLGCTTGTQYCTLSFLAQRTLFSSIHARYRGDCPRAQGARE
jgi:hypothetical protein